MSTSRLETFSDGVIAIIITIMVLELKAPAGTNLSDLVTLAPTFLAYLLSFWVVGIYWNNHHHLLQTVKTLNSHIMWANLHLLFWLSLIPFFTGWLGENYTQSWPTACYGILLLLAAFAYQILAKIIINTHQQKQELTQNLGSDVKGKLSLICYILAVILAFYQPILSDILYASVAIIWFIPDRRLLLEPKGE